MKVFSDEHEMFRAAVRSFIDKEVVPHTATCANTPSNALRATPDS
jgi:Acyl-CoA dehydrogenase, N-terminal domain